jgi:hypothetical protein
MSTPATSVPHSSLEKACLESTLLVLPSILSLQLCPMPVATPRPVATVRSLDLQVWEGQLWRLDSGAHNLQKLLYSPLPTPCWAWVCCHGCFSSNAKRLELLWGSPPLAWTRSRTQEPHLCSTPLSGFLLPCCFPLTLPGWHIPSLSCQTPPCTCFPRRRKAALDCSPSQDKAWSGELMQMNLSLNPSPATCYFSFFNIGV